MQRDMAVRLLDTALAWCRPPFHMGGRGRIKLQGLFDYDWQRGQAGAGAECLPPPVLAVRELRASRARFLGELPHFDCPRSGWTSSKGQPS